MENNALTPFEGKEIRKIWHDEQWYFSLVDVIEVLTESPAPRQYWNILKKREPQLSTICLQLKLKSSDGKNYSTDCANTEGVLRIVMSVPSPKAEPLKLWMAHLGKQAIDETENPELMTERQMAIYKAKGYPDEWIKERIQNIDTRKRLTDEWQKRGVKEGQEFSILTAVISKGTFNIIPSEHKNIKNLTKPSQNLRDHMTELELILTSLGEAVTRTVAVDTDAQGFEENKIAAIKGGKTAGEARERVEAATGKKVVSSENYLKQPNEIKQLPQEDNLD
jgi:DNA-damage-inducible protein D